MAHEPTEHYQTEAEVITANALLALRERDGKGEYALQPYGSTWMDLERFHPAPRRKSGTVTLHETSSFNEYVSKHKDADSLIYCDRKNATFQAVLDAHSADAPRWQEHRAQLTLQKTPEWETWVSHNKHGFEQVKFAEFIEANLPDIIKPPGADLLEMTLALEEKRNITFSSAMRLSDGQRQFTYNEEAKGTSKSGQVNIPSQFTLELAPFYGAPERAIPTLLRYRIKDGRANFWYEMPRIEEIERDAVEGAATEIREKAGVPVLYGVPHGR